MNISVSNSDPESAYRKRRVLYLSPYVDETIFEERGLRSRNVAGSNRTLRISTAMRRAGFRPIILSAATSLRAYRRGGPVLHRARVRRQNGIAVVFAPALNLPMLNVFTTLLFQALVLRRLLRRPLAGSVIYNFSPSMVFFAVWLGLKPGVRLLNNVEDVSIPQFRDWKVQTEARPMQQLVFWICMNLVARICDAYIVPTRRFLSYLPRKPSEVITGCIEIPSVSVAPLAPPRVRVLFAGKIEREHGIVQFVEALEALDSTAVAMRLQVDVSGTGHMLGWVIKRLSQLETLQATVHGFVSNEQYQELISSAHICVALQDPKGRYAQFKTPSKVYEFLGYGKAVIATHVGDVREITRRAICVLDALEGAEIAQHLARLSQDSDALATLQREARQHSIDHFSYEVVGARVRRLMQEDLG